MTRNDNNIVLGKNGTSSNEKQQQESRFTSDGDKSTSRAPLAAGFTFPNSRM